MFEKIYIISVSDQEERRAEIQEELWSLGWNNFEFIDSERGDSLENTKKLIEDRVLDKTFIDPYGNLSKNIIACSLSHKKAYSKFLKDGFETCLILEDDVRISTTGLKYLLRGQFYEIQNELSSIDWDIFIWGLVGTNVPHYDENFNNFKYIREYKKYSPDWAAHAYQITRDAAHKLILNNSPVKFAADVNLETSNVNIYCTPFTLLEQTAGNVSRFEADRFKSRLDSSISEVLFLEHFKSSTSKNMGMESLNGDSIYDIYFGTDRNLKYEKTKFVCSIDKDLEISGVRFKDFIDQFNNIQPNWCYIDF